MSKLIVSNGGRDHDLLVQIVEKVDSIYTRLFGDGETGDIPQMRKDVDHLKEYKSKIVGAFAILSFIITILSGIVVSNILKGH